MVRSIKEKSFKCNTLNNTSVLHQTEQKHIKIVKNYNSNGHPFTTTTTSSSIKLSVAPTAAGKSVISPYSMSMERKNSIQYTSRKIVSCIIPAGQSTVIHLDSYTHFMAQRFTNTKTALKKTNIVKEVHNSITVSGSTISSNGIDINLNVFGASNSSSHHSNSKRLDMNKQNQLDTDTQSSTPPKRGRKKPLSLELKKLKDVKLLDLKKNKSKTSTSPKPMKKPKKVGRKKSIKQKAIKSKIKVVTGAGEAIINNSTETDKGELEHLQTACNTQFTKNIKILRPCISLLQNKKCISETCCQYLHSDFPCKYYYLNLPCPQGFKCQFMHNGPLELKLTEALRCHILELLSTKPSATDIYFVEQMNNIEDLSCRLQSFCSNQIQNSEVIEVIDDADHDQVLHIDETRNDAENFVKVMTTNCLLAETPATDENQIVQPKTNNLNLVYKDLKETNLRIDELDKKLKNLKNSSNLTPDEKIFELQKIYDLLKEQEKRLPIYENFTTTTTNKQLTSEKDSLYSRKDTEPHYILVSPDMVNDISTLESQVNTIIITDDEKTTTLAEPKEPLLVDDEFLSKDDDNQLVINEELSNRNFNNDSTKVAANDGCNEFYISSSMDYEDESDVMIVEETFEQVEQLSGQTVIENVIGNPQIDISLDESSCLDSNKTEDMKLNTNLISLNETLENDEKAVIDNNVEVIMSKAHLEELSPPYEEIVITSPRKKNRINLRSHIIPDNPDNNIQQSTCAILQIKKPIKTRRLRLPKPSQKTTKNFNIDKFPINADVINKLIETTDENKKTKNLENEKVQSCQKNNITLSNRYLKKVNARLAKNSLSPAVATKPEASATPKATDCHNAIEQNMLASHNDIIKNPVNIENVCIFLPSQPLTDTSCLNSAQSKIAFDNQENNNNMSTSSDTSFKSIGNTDNQHKFVSSDFKNCDTLKKSNSKERFSFEKFTSTFNTPMKLQFNLGNPHVVLPKLKKPFLIPKSEKGVHGDITTSTSSNAIVDSSTSLGDGKSTQKRCSLTSEYDLDKNLKESKYLKIGKSNSTQKRKLEIMEHNRTYSEHSTTSKDADFDTDSSCEKLVISDSFQALPSDDIEHQKTVEPPSANVLTYQEVEYSHSSPHECKEQQEEYEFELRQQIENINNEKHLQFQEENPKQTAVENTAVDAAIIDTSSINLVAQEDLKEYQENIKEDKAEMANILNSLDDTEKYKNGRTQSLDVERVEEPVELTSACKTNNDKYSNETTPTEKLNVEHSTYSSLLNKLSINSTKPSINFENFSVNITPISSPIYGDTIASPSPIKKSGSFRLGGEIDGSLTNPPIPYILYEIDLKKLDVNKPNNIDKLKRTIQLDPRIFRTQVKKQSITLFNTVDKTSNSVVRLETSNSLSLSNDTSFFAQPTTSMISAYDPRNRTPAIMADIATPSLTQQTALTAYNSLQTAVMPSQSSSSIMHTDIPSAVALQYGGTTQPIIIQPQVQQTPNMFLYGCLQRSPWYQSLMSTMKIQINQSISQLVRALNNYHRERLLNPGMTFDVFKIDCAGEILEIMRNLGIYVDANGCINEQRPLPLVSKRSSCNAMSVNSTYSFIQQFLTPHTNCTSAASSIYNTLDGQVNDSEPFVSCYVKGPERQQNNSDDSVQCTHHSHHNDNNSSDNYNNHQSNNNNRHYNNNNQFKKRYNDNSNDNGNGNSSPYQQSSGQRYNNNKIYSNNPRFVKPGCYSPTKLNSSPPNSERKKFGGDSYGSGRGSRGGRGGGERGRGRGGYFNNNRRFNNFNNSDNNENRYNNNGCKNNSPPQDSAQNSFNRSRSPETATQLKNSSPPPKAASGKTNSNDDEECWDSD